MINVAEVAQSYNSSIIITRWAANLIDNIFVFYNFLILPYFLQERYGEKIIGTSDFLLIVLAGLIFIFFYFSLMEGLTGYTIGKFIFRLRVVKANGTLPGLGKAMLRALFRAFEVYLIGLIGFVSAITSKEKQRLGDMFAKTYVLKSKNVVIEPNGLNWLKFTTCGLLFSVILGAFTVNIDNIRYSALHPDVIAKNKEKIVISNDKQSQLTLLEGWSEDYLYLNDIDAQIKVINLNESIFLISHTYSKSELPSETKLKDVNMFINDDLLKKTSPRKKLEINGYQAIQFYSKRRIDFSNYNYLFTVIETSDNFHLVICWTEASPFGNYKQEEMEEAVKGFREVIK